MDFYFLIPQLLLIGIGVYLLAYRQIVRYHAEKIIFQVEWRRERHGSHRYPGASIDTLLPMSMMAAGISKKALNLVSFGILSRKKFITTWLGSEVALEKSAAMVSGMWNK